jgi:hypothetical protein
MTEQTGPAPEKEPSGAAKMFGDFAPALVFPAPGCPLAVNP